MSDIMDSEQGGTSSKHLISFDGSSKHLKSYEDNNGEHGILAQRENSRSPSSSESSVESSDVEKIDLTYPLLKSKQADLDTQQADLETQDSGYNPSVSIQPYTTPSPPPQTMGHPGPGGYDPNRIPASIFSSKPANPMEWSIASNESLFSIHMSNNSFSRDHVFFLYKSGEIPRLDEISPVPPSLDVVNAEENVEKHIENKQKDSDVREEELADTAKMEPRFSANMANAVSSETEKNVGQEKIPQAEEVRNSSSSTQSFQFPVLDSDMERQNSAKVVMGKQPSQEQVQQEPQPQTPGTTPKPAGNSWLSCFSCCSFGC